MDEWKLPWEGGCRCGATRIWVTKPPLLTMACHCAGCQRMSAERLFAVGRGPADGFEVTEGAPVLGGEGRDMHHFCPRCMTWMFTRPPGIDFLVNVRAPVLDDHLWVVPFVETFTGEGSPGRRRRRRTASRPCRTPGGWQELTLRSRRKGRGPALGQPPSSLPS